MYLAYNAPHEPLEAPQEEIDEFLSLGKFNTAVSTVYAMIKRMDEGIGEVLHTIKECGIDEDTLILFTSDNGPCFRGEGDRCQKRYNCSLNGSKGNVLEGGIKIPAILRWPGTLEEGVICNEEVHFTDWLPTLMEIIGENISTSMEVDGNSILNILKGEPQKQPFQKYWQWNRYAPIPHCNVAMREGKWKLYYPAIEEGVRYYQSDSQISMKIQARPDLEYELIREPVLREISSEKSPKLFNLEEDPYEQKDLADQYPKRTAEMIRKLDDWFDQMTMEWEEKGKKTLGELWVNYKMEKEKNHEVD